MQGIGTFTRGWISQLVSFATLVLLGLIAYRFPKIGVEFTAGGLTSSLFVVGDFGDVGPVAATLGDGRFVVGFEHDGMDDDFDTWATIFDPRTSATVNFPSPFCDFDDDGKSGVLWRHDSGQVYFWEMNGLGIKAEGGVSHAAVPGDWHIFFS